jgi:hypothetical protein
MRELTVGEIGFVGGGAEQCTSDQGSNNYGGVTDTGSLGDDLIEIYEGLVQATSYVIERVANALG